MQRVSEALSQSIWKCDEWGASSQRSLIKNTWQKTRHAHKHKACRKRSGLRNPFALLILNVAWSANGRWVHTRLIWKETWQIWLRAPRLSEPSLHVTSIWMLIQWNNSAEQGGHYGNEVGSESFNRMEWKAFSSVWPFGVGSAFRELTATAAG